MKSVAACPAESGVKGVSYAESLRDALEIGLEAPEVEPDLGLRDMVKGDDLAV